MSKFDQNPFDEESDSNPYASSASTASAPSQSGGSFFSRMTPKFSQSSFSASEADASAPSAKELEKKERELKALEDNLKRKEEELAQKESSLGVELKNFPPFWPLIHHDITTDIPVHSRAIQYAAFWSWMGIMLCLMYNLVAAIIAWIAGTFYFTDGMGNFFLALIYFLVGVPLSYFLWYSRLYTALRKDGAVSFTIFFVFYGIHILFCIFAVLAPPFLWSGCSFTGVMCTIDIFDHNWVTVGIIFLVGTALFAVECIGSFYVFGRVFGHFRGQK